MKLSNSRFVLDDIDRGRAENTATPEEIFWRFVLVLACMDALLFAILR